MAYLLPFNPTASQQLPQLTDNKSTKSINTARKSVLVVESDKAVSNYIVRLLSDAGYAPRTAQTGQEGLRLYRDCAPFSIVVIDYSVPQKQGEVIDYCEPQLHGIELAMAICDINPAQTMIITAFDYRSADEVPRPPELIHVYLCTDVGSFQWRNLLEKINVDSAIQALTTSELLKLKQFARSRIFALGRAARGRTCDDLLNEAMLRTLMGAESLDRGRHWNKNVDFVRHLIGAMQSITHCWKRTFNENEPYLACDLLRCDAEGQEISPLDGIASDCPDAYQKVMANEKAFRLLASFKSDQEATYVIEGLLDELSKNEILRKYELSEKRYEAALKRIRRRVWF